MKAIIKNTKCILFALAITIQGIVIPSLLFISCSNKEANMLSHANDLVKNNNYDSALIVIDELIELNPENTFAYIEKCKIFIFQNNEELAEQTLQKALENSSDDYTGRGFLSLGKLFYEKNKYKNAILCFESAIKNGDKYSHSYALTSDPSPGAETKWYRSYSFYFFILGNAYAKSGQCENAYKSFNTAIGVANKGLNSRDMMQEGVDLVFSGESSNRQDYEGYVGSFFYNRSLISGLLGKSNDSNEDMQMAKKLNYINQIVLNASDVQCN